NSRTQRMWGVGEPISNDGGESLVRLARRLSRGMDGRLSDERVDSPRDGAPTGIRGGSLRLRWSLGRRTGSGSSRPQGIQIGRGRGNCRAFTVGYASGVGP